MVRTTRPNSRNARCSLFFLLKELFGSGLSKSEIAKKLGIGRTAVRKLLNKIN